MNGDWCVRSVSGSIACELCGIELSSWQQDDNIPGLCPECSQETVDWFGEEAYELFRSD